VTDPLGSKIVDRTITLFWCWCGFVVTIHSLTDACWHGTCPRVAHPREATNHCVCMMCVVVVVVFKEKEILNKGRIEEQYQDTALQSRSRSREGWIAPLAQQQHPQPQQQSHTQQQLPQQQSHTQQQEPPQHIHSNQCIGRQEYL